MRILAFSIFSIIFFLIFRGLPPKTSVTLLSHKQCQIQENDCLLYSPDGKQIAKLSLTPRPINNSKKFEVNLYFMSDLKLKKLPNISFQGVNMDLLKQQDLLKSTPNSYKIETKLPFCTLKKMQWTTLIKLETVEKSYQSIINFEALN